MATRARPTTRTARPAPPPKLAAAASVPLPSSMCKCIVDQRTLKTWQRSESYRDVLTYVQELSTAIGHRRLTEELPTSPRVRAVCDALDKMRRWIAEIPPAKQAMRYGNTAFKGWHARLLEYAPSLMQQLVAAPASNAPPLPCSFIESALPTRKMYEASLTMSNEERAQVEGAARQAAASHASAGGAASAPISAPPAMQPPTGNPASIPGAAAELAVYFCESFGNATRIDYGTGHELAFVIWLHCLERIGVLLPTDRAAVALVAFRRYLTLMRELQTTYWLEPAGAPTTHGPSL